MADNTAANPLLDDTVPPCACPPHAEMGKEMTQEGRSRLRTRRLPAAFPLSVQAGLRARENLIRRLPKRRLALSG